MSSPTRSRRGSVYLAIMVVVAAVSTLVLTGVALRSHLHERSTMGSESAAARRLATSAAELVVHAASSNAAAFQEAAAAGTLFEDLPLRPGVISATVTDADTKAAVTATTSNYRVIARADTDRTTSRIAMLLETPDDDLSRLKAADPNAVGYWPLDEFNQTVAVDKIGGRNGIYAVASSAGAFTHAHGGRSPRMNWMTEYVQIPHHSNFALADGTLTFWVRFDLKPTSAGLQMSAVSKEKTPATTAMNLAVFLEHDYLYYRLNNAGNRGASVRVSSSSIVEGNWHFVAVSWGDAGMKLYLDGILRAENSTAADLQAVILSRVANTFDWYFGVRNIPESIYQQSRSVFGSVARVGLFNIQLSESSIQTVYEATSQPPGILPVPGSFATVVD